MTARYRYRGFTLIELLVTLAVVGIMIGLAVPAFTNLVRSSRALTQSGLLPNALNYARSEAVRRGAQVYITGLNGDTSWTQGWRVWVDVNGDNAYTANVDTELKRQAPLSGDGSLTSSTGATQLIFTSTGSLVGGVLGVDANNEVRFEYRANNADCKLGKDIHLNLIGRTYIDKQGGC